jgi:hypothetical protein
MSIRRKVRGQRTVVAARILAASILLAVPGLVVRAGPAAAALQNCPAPSNGFTWTLQFQSRGVTLCSGQSSSSSAVMQIIDFNAGAKVRVETTLPAGEQPGNPRTQFIKRSGGGWWDWIKALPTAPSGDRLFSVMNASFFIDTISSTTALSMPAWASGGAVSKGEAWFGLNEAWNVPKKKLLFSRPDSATNPLQKADIVSFPMHYSSADVVNGIFGSSFAGDSGVVGYEPLATVTPPPPAIAERNMVGSSPGKLYTVQTGSTTLATAQSLLWSAGSTSEIQLDGGCSDQFFSNYAGDPYYIGWFWSSSPWPQCPRTVPNVLAVYVAP